MRKLYLAVYCSLLCTFAQAQTKVVIYADNSYPPYAYQQDGQMQGVYTHILQKIFQKMPDFQIEFRPIAWKRGLALMEQGGAFAIYPPYKRPLMRPFMEYDHPIIDEELVLVCHDEVAQEPRKQWPKDYYGLIIGNNTGFAAGGDAFWLAVKEKKITVEETNSAANNLRKLISGRIDCYMNDKLSIQWELNNLQTNGEYSGTGIQQIQVLSREQGYLAFSIFDDRFQYKAQFKQQYLKILRQMQQSGEIEDLIEAYFQ